VKATNEQLSAELSSRSRQLATATKALDNRRRDVEAQERELEAVQRQAADYANEQKTPLQQHLSEQEKLELQALLERRDPLTELIGSCQSRLMEIGSTRERLRADLSDNLCKRRDDAQGRLRLIAASGASTSGMAGSSLQPSEQVAREDDTEYAALETEAKLLEAQVSGMYTLGA
jgi:hypothetical protein